MYAVIRAGGKQYRVAPGDVIRVEKMAHGQNNEIEFGDVLAVSANEGEIGRPQGEAHVVGQVLGEVRGDKVLVFHFKRKKQYKKLQGHRQDYTAVRITEIAFDGHKFTAPEQPKPQPKAARKPQAEEGTAPEEAAAPKKKAGARKSARGEASGAGSKTAAAHHDGSAKKSGKKAKGGPSSKSKKK
jgi:large subunit ribosomal protein L21